VAAGPYPAEPWPPDPYPAEHGLYDEPTVQVPVGLLGQAIELLDLCDELLNHPGHTLIDAHVRTVVNRYHTTPHTLRWLYDGLGATAGDLQDLLDTMGIIVDPTLRGRPTHHRRYR
jgi:hypothetical protein